MNRSDIEQTLQTILDQIHGNENNGSGRKTWTAAEIAQIFLGSSEEQSQQRHTPIVCHQKFTSRLIIYGKRGIKRALRLLMRLG